MRQPLDVLEHDVDVDGLALDRALVGEHFHAVDELDDAVGLVADQPCQGAILVADRLFEQLRRAADAGERILDFVRQHGRERGHRARGAAMGELAVHLVGDRAFLQHDDHVVRSLRQRRHVQVDEAFAGITRRAEIDLVLVDRRSARAHLVDERQQGASERHEVAQAMTAQQRQGGFEERSRRRRWRWPSRPSAETMMTGCGNASSTASAVPEGSVGMGSSRLMPPSSAGPAERVIGLGKMAVNEAGLVGGQHPLAMCLEQPSDAPAVSAAALSAQPRCLRAWRRPTARPWCDSISS